MVDPQGTSEKTERARLKRRAVSALRHAGRSHLTDLGLRPVGSSPRQWLGDFSWWLINVEFQASSWSVGAYLNVGLQYLWTVTDNRSFGHANPRVQIPGCGQFASLEGTESEVAANADAVARTARSTVLELINVRREDGAHLKRLAQSSTSGLRASLDGAMATALLGRCSDASTEFARIQHSLDDTIEWQERLAADCGYLAGLAHDPDLFRSEIDERIAETRRRLHLPPRNEGGAAQSSSGTE